MTISSCPAWAAGGSSSAQSGGAVVVVESTGSSSARTSTWLPDVPVQAVTATVAQQHHATRRVDRAGWRERFRGIDTTLVGCLAATHAGSGAVRGRLR